MEKWISVNELGRYNKEPDQLKNSGYFLIVEKGKNSRYKSGRSEIQSVQWTPRRERESVPVSYQFCYRWPHPN